MREVKHYLNTSKRLGNLNEENSRFEKGKVVSVSQILKRPINNNTRHVIKLIDTILLWAENILAVG